MKKINFNQMARIIHKLEDGKADLTIEQIKEVVKWNYILGFSMELMIDQESFLKFQNRYKKKIKEVGLMINSGELWG